MDPDAAQAVIAGKYQLIRQLGRGAMGAVWQARHLSLRSNVAVKLMDPAIAASATGLQRFLREARAAAGLRSPHVVQVLDHGVDQGTPYIVMEVLEGESLAARLDRIGRLTPLDTARIVTHIARALARAEQAGVTHRDLKPDNVFLVPNDDEEIAKVLDFGIAKVEQVGFDWSFHEESTAAGALLGTPYYVSPEQAAGLKTIDHRTDLWSLGVIAFECLLGKRPFEGETLPALLLAICSKPMPIPSSVGAVPQGFDAWFAKACARDLTDRFAFAKDAAAELAKLCERALSTTPTRRPLPRLPTLIGHEPEQDEAPTEIWRGGSLATLVGVGAQVDPHAESKGGGFSQTAKDGARNHKRSLVAACVGALLAACALAWALASPRGSASPHTLQTHTAQVPAQASIAATQAPAQGLAAKAAPSAELVPTVELGSLPIAPPPPARVVRPRRPPAPEAAPSAKPPVEATSDERTPRRRSSLLPDTDENMVNPYR